VTEERQLKGFHTAGNSPEAVEKELKRGAK
jgi:hypothetical protein